MNPLLAAADAELADILAGLGNPPAICLATLRAKAAASKFCRWYCDRRNSVAITRWLKRSGYVRLQSPACDGAWMIGKGERRNIYVKAQLTFERQVAEANALVNRHRPPKPTRRAQKTTQAAIRRLAKGCPHRKPRETALRRPLARCETSGKNSFGSK